MSQQPGTDAIGHTEDPPSFPGLDEPMADAGEADPPSMPTDLAQSLPSTVVAAGVHRVLLSNSGQLGSVYRAMVKHPGEGPTEILKHTDCASVQVVSNLLATLRAILGIDFPEHSPARARQAASAVNSLTKKTSGATADYLTSVRDRLRDISTDPGKVAQEDETVRRETDALEGQLRSASGVYVYTYPHYRKHPYSEAEPSRIVLKVGRTGASAWQRISSQSRHTGMPEDPEILRVYKTDDPMTAEKRFHSILEAAEHSQMSGNLVGREWFLTTLDLCDAIAEAMDLTIVRNTGIN